MMSKLGLIAFFIALIALFGPPLGRAQGGSSCYRYGHSCWGGHGKRSGIERRSNIREPSATFRQNIPLNDMGRNQPEYEENIPFVDFVDENVIDDYMGGGSEPSSGTDFKRLGQIPKSEDNLSEVPNVVSPRLYRNLKRSSLKKTRKTLTPPNAVIYEILKIRRK